MQSPNGVRASLAQRTLAVVSLDLGTIAVSGPDRASWLNGLVTANVTKVRGTLAGYGFFLVRQGRILSDVRILERGDRILLGVPRTHLALVREHMEKFLLMEDAAHEDASAESTWVSLHGPFADSLAGALAAEHGVAWGTLDVTGLGGAVLVVPQDKVEAVKAELARRSTEALLGSDADWQALRIECGFPVFGVDYSDKHGPKEASLEKLGVSFNKGCYIGQEVVLRMQSRGQVIRSVVPLVFEGPAPSAPTEVRSSQGKPIGTLTSSSGTWGLAMLRRDFAEPGTVVDAGGVTAKVSGAEPADPSCRS